MHRCRWLLVVVLSVTIGLVHGLTTPPGTMATAAEPKFERGKWQVAFQSKKLPGVRPLPEESLVKSLVQLDLQGSHTKDPYHLGAYAINGDFGLHGGLLTRIAGKNAAVQLAEQLDEFELEAGIQAESLGGWFWLIGWHDGHGYVLYNVTLKTSGSPWLLAEFRGGNGIAETLREINRLEWKGSQGFQLSVVQQKLNVMVGDARIARDIELPNYHPGAVIVGTYDTPYGPRELSLQGVRHRTVKVIEPKVQPPE
jgi:hypothetical protein